MCIIISFYYEVTTVIKTKKINIKVYVSVHDLLKIICCIFINYVFMFGPILAPETLRCWCPQSCHCTHSRDGQFQISHYLFYSIHVKCGQDDGQ